MPKGTVLVRALSYVIRGRITNVSHHGLSAASRMTAPERLLGSKADIELRLDGRSSAWLKLSGRIVRIAASSLAIVFEGVPPAPFVRLIDDMLIAGREQRQPSIVLVDARDERRSAIAGAFRDAGCALVEVSTPLEAIFRLGESQFEPDLIAIANSEPGSIADELRRFVGLEHPRAKLIAIDDLMTGGAIPTMLARLKMA